MNYDTLKIAITIIVMIEISVTFYVIKKLHKINEKTKKIETKYNEIKNKKEVD